jgi:hypothetical protein
MNDLPHHASARFIRHLAICATFATLMHGGLLSGLITMVLLDDLAELLPHLPALRPPRLPSAAAPWFGGKLIDY